MLTVLVAASLQFNAQILPWQAQCSALTPGLPADCQPPVAAGAQPGTEPLTLPLATVAGQASETEQNFSLGAYSGRISLYSVYPEASTGLPQYIQVRIDLAAPYRATCAESVRLRDPMELPPVICGAFGPAATAMDSSTQEAGVTVSFSTNR